MQRHCHGMDIVLPKMLKTEQNAVSEGTRRLRAVVRTSMSSGVWLVIVAQFLFMIFLFPGLGNSEVGTIFPLRVLLVILSVLFILFLSAGAYRALAVTDGVVASSVTIGYAATVFNQYMWLMVKAAVLAFFILSLLLSIHTSIMGPEQTQALIQQPPAVFGLIFAVLGFIFVYWLPIVFVTGKFILFPTLVLALRVAARRWPQAGFLALLVVVPVLLALALPTDVSPVIIALFNTFSQLLGWIAYVYCVEFVVREKKAVLLSIEQQGS